MKFFFLLIKEYGGDKAQEFSKPIDEMAMEPELKALLKDFKSATLEELFNTAYEFEFRKLNWFNTIRRFMLTYKSLHFDERKKKKKSRVKPAEGKEEVGRKGIRISSFYRKKAKPKLRLNSVYMTGNYNLN